MSRYDCIVIGGGHNGLTAAATLARKGKKVIVVEKNDILGGLCASQEFHPGYHTAGLLNDTATVRERVVAALNLKKFGLKLTDAPPSVFIPSQDGKGILLHHDAKLANDEIAAYSQKDAVRYGEYRAFLKRISAFLQRVFDDLPPDVYSMNFHGLWDLMKKAVALRMLGKSDMMEMLRIGPMCVADWLNEWFETEPLKAALAGPAIYGTFAGPWSPSTNANLIMYECMARHSVVGGPSALFNALYAACKAYGVEIRSSAEVSRIIVQDQIASGVELKDGTVLNAPIIAASCDPKRTFLKLVASDQIPFQLEQRVENFRMRGTTAKVNLALKRPLEFACRKGLTPEYIRIAESLDDLERAFDAVKYGAFSVIPALDVFVPTVSDPSLAPAGCHVASILVHFAAYDLKGGWTAEQKKILGDTVVAVLKKYSPDIESAIVAKEVLTPVDLETRYGLTFGHIHHGEHAADQILMRPTPETSKYSTPIKGLYLSGSGSHPGGGITCAPGSLAAATILQN